MKRLLLLLMAILLTGCLDLGINVKIAKDWSGELALKVEMLDQVFQMLISPQLGQQTGVDLSLIDEEKLRALIADHGGQVRSYSNTLENGVRIIEMQAAVPNVRKLLEQSGGDQITIKRDGDLWTLNVGDNATLNTFLNMEDELLEQQLTMLAPSLTGLKMSLNIQVPELLETNLSHSGNTATFAMDFDEDVTGKTGRQAVLAFKKMLAPKTVKFKGPVE